MTRDQVMICYARKDREWKELLSKNLKPLQDSGRLKVWDDSMIAPGDVWKREIGVAMARTRVAVLLVSQDFLASDFIRNVELPVLVSAADQGELRIFPVHIRPSMADEMDIGRFQSVVDGYLEDYNLKGRQSAAVKITRAILEAYDSYAAQPTQASTQSERWVLEAKLPKTVVVGKSHNLFVRIVEESQAGFTTSVVDAADSLRFNPGFPNDGVLSVRREIRIYAPEFDISDPPVPHPMELAKGSDFKEWFTVRPHARGTLVLKVRLCDGSTSLGAGLLESTAIDAPPDPITHAQLTLVVNATAADRAFTASG